ncbi:MAG: hypothetical protein WBN32_02250, partial [Woeseia sp.]
SKSALRFPDLAYGRQNRRKATCFLLLVPSLSGHRIRQGAEKGNPRAASAWFFPDRIRAESAWFFGNSNRKTTKYRGICLASAGKVEAD